MSKNIRYTQSQVMIKEVTLNAEGMYLNIHGIICMLSFKYEIDKMKVIRNCQIINHNYATENGGLYLKVTEQKLGLWVRAGLPGHQGKDLEN